MKLLLDQNLSSKLVAELDRIYPGTAHVRELGFAKHSDEVIWEHARRNGFVIVSKDADFHQRSFVFGHPPKVVWIRRGNCSSGEALALLLERRTELEEFDRHPDAAFLVLS